MVERVSYVKHRGDTFSDFIRGPIGQKALNAAGLHEIRLKKFRRRRSVEIVLAANQDLDERMVVVTEKRWAGHGNEMHIKPYRYFLIIPRDAELVVPNQEA